MIIKTSIFGEIAIEDAYIISFPNGIPGFSGEKQFCFIPIEDTLFTVMHSVVSDLYFFVINPFDYFKDYEFDIPNSDVDLLAIDNEEDVAVWNIIVIRDNDLEKSTVNMKAPIIVNKRANSGKQIILDKYTTKQPLFVQSASEACINR